MARCDLSRILYLRAGVVAGRPTEEKKLKDAVTIQPSRAWMDLLQAKHPELFAHGKNYAIECLIAEKLGMPRPRTPAEASASSRKGIVVRRKV